jgi:hypothetical protein
VGHVLQGNDVGRQRPAQGLPERDGGGRDRNGTVEGELPGFLPRVGQMPVLHHRRVLVSRVLVRYV